MLTGWESRLTMTRPRSQSAQDNAVNRYKLLSIASLPHSGSTVSGLIFGHQHKIIGSGGINLAVRFFRIVFDMNFCAFDYSSHAELVACRAFKHKGGDK
jgi:hypothetical protein